MAKSEQIQVVGIRRQEIDVDKLAFAYVLLDQSLLAAKDEQAERPRPGGSDD